MNNNQSFKLKKKKLKSRAVCHAMLHADSLLDLNLTTQCSSSKVVRMDII